MGVPGPMTGPASSILLVADLGVPAAIAERLSDSLPSALTDGAAADGKWDVSVRRDSSLVRELPCRQPTGEAAFDHRGDQVVLVREMPVDRARRQSALLTDQRNARAFVAALRCDFGGGVKDAFARSLSSFMIG